MSKKRTFIQDDIDEVIDVVWKQFKEDRDVVTSLCGELKLLVSGSIEKHVTAGQNLAKYAELMTKQTQQIIDFLKIIKKENEKSDELSEEDMKAINDSIK